MSGRTRNDAYAAYDTLWYIRLVSLLFGLYLLKITISATTAATSTTTVTAAARDGGAGVERGRKKPNRRVVGVSYVER